MAVHKRSPLASQRLTKGGVTTRSTLTLEQKQLFRGQQTFTLAEHGELRVATKVRGARQEFIIELCNLNPRSARLANTAAVSFYAGILFSIGYVVLIICMFTIWSSGKSPILGAFVGSAMCGLFMLPIISTCFSRWRNQNYDITSFSNRWTGNPALRIRNTDPDPATAAEFITELTRRIALAEPVAAGGNGIADQIARLDELQRKGVLSADEFCTAKQRVLAGEVVERKIGF
jgi:hypothetical protein